MKWLVTAFEPFGGASSNSSLTMLRQLRRQDWQGALEFLEPIPVRFMDGWEHLRVRIPRDVDGILALGQAETRAKIGLERVALNWIDARIRDNAGAQPLQAKIDAGKPDMFWCNIPWDKFELTSASERSYSAGTFVCNELMFRMMDWAASSGKLAGFVHVPALESQTDLLTSVRMSDAVAEAELRRILSFLVSL